MRSDLVSRIPDHFNDFRIFLRGIRRKEKSCRDSILFENAENHFRAGFEPFVPRSPTADIGLHIETEHRANSIHFNTSI